MLFALFPCKPSLLTGVNQRFVDFSSKYQNKAVEWVEPGGGGGPDGGGGCVIESILYLTPLPAYPFLFCMNLCLSFIRDCFFVVLFVSGSVGKMKGI